MSERLGVTVGWPAAAGAVSLVAIGSLLSYILLRPGGQQEPQMATQASSPTQTAKVVVNQAGYEPPRLTLRAGVPASITFLRTTDKTCGTEVVFPALNIKRDLPLNAPVDVEFTPSRGEVAFTCGMNMMQGMVVVEW